MDDLKLQFFDTDESDSKTPESPVVDTGCLLQYKQLPVNTTQADIDLDIDTPEDQLQIEDPQDFLEEDTLLPNSDASHDQSYNTAKDASLDLLMKQGNDPFTQAENMDLVSTSLSKVGCIEVTNYLQKYLHEYQ